jgi:Flp pilus assembly protein TadD
MLLPAVHLLPLSCLACLMGALLVMPSLKPPTPGELVELGVAYHKLRDPRAEAVFVRALAQQPEHARGQLGYGLWLSDQSRVAEAERALQRAAALEPANPDPMLSLAVLYQRADRYEEAYATYVKLRAAHPEDPRYTFNAAMLAIKRGRDREAYDLLSVFLKQPGAERRQYRSARRTRDQLAREHGWPLLPGGAPTEEKR